jgi:hypothetical protein
MSSTTLPFAFCDDGIVREVEGITTTDDANSAGKKLGADVLMLLEPHKLHELSRNINEVVSGRARQQALDTLNALPLDQALWWFIENITDEMPYRSDLYFRLRERLPTELSRN